jgi:hypothetical protein
MDSLISSTRGLLLAMCLLLVAPASALADCGTTVINDYLDDGAISGTYSVACYQQALGEIPTDADIYTDIRASITAAMVKAGGTPATTDAGSTTDTTAAAPGSSTDGGVVGQALNSIGPKNADEVPVPVIILGALALLLILAGVGGLIVQRTSRKRKAATGDPPAGETSAPETAT